jgi:hypothetical protein
MSRSIRLLRPVLALTVLVMLAGCVVAPASPYYGGPAYGGPGYAAGPTVVVPVTPYYYGGYYGGYRGGWGHYR